MVLPYNENTLTMIVGSMYSSKTTTLFAYIEKFQYAKKKIMIFSIEKDNRYGVGVITNHNGKQVDSFAVKSSIEILEKVNTEVCDVVFIDEVQFFDDGIIEVIESLLKDGKKVVAAGLDQDFLGRGFGPVPELLARAENVIKLTAVCSVCGKSATRSQRLIDGRPASPNDEIFKLGSQETYEARCREHHYTSEI